MTDRECFEQLIKGLELESFLPDMNQRKLMNTSMNTT